MGPMAQEPGGASLAAKSDDQLVKAAKSGNTAAFETLVGRHYYDPSNGITSSGDIVSFAGNATPVQIPINEW